MLRAAGRSSRSSPRAATASPTRAFQTAIDAVSAKGQIRWGVEHLYYELCRRLARTARIRAADLRCGSRSSVSSCRRVGELRPRWLGTVGGHSRASAGVLRSLVAAAEGRRRTMTVGLEPGGVRPAVADWLSAHGNPPGLIVRKSKPAPPRSQESDIGDYSFDRAVICDRARTVDLLIANNFHFENNCAVLSIGGYPEGPFELVRTMLKRNPKLQVFALHDASVAGLPAGVHSWRTTRPGSKGGRR